MADKNAAARALGLDADPVMRRQTESYVENQKKADLYKNISQYMFWGATTILGGLAFAIVAPMVGGGGHLLAALPHLPLPLWAAYFFRTKVPKLLNAATLLTAISIPNTKHTAWCRNLPKRKRRGKLPAIAPYRSPIAAAAKAGRVA